MRDATLTQIQNVIVQICFYAPLAFLVVYSARTPWWRTVHGRTLAALAFVFVFVLFRAMLFVWGVLSYKQEQNPDLLSWISVFVLLLAPLAFATMTWQLLRKPLRQWWNWMHDGTTDLPLTGDTNPNSWPENGKEGHRSGTPATGGQRQEEDS